MSVCEEEDWVNPPVFNKKDIEVPVVHYSKIVYGDVMNGPGLRLSIWLSGCPHNCDKCFAPETHDKNYGDVLDSKTEEEIKFYLSNPCCEGITILGGEPLSPDNYYWTLNMAKYVCSLGRSVIIYTGYRHEHIPYEMDKWVDMYIDGMYIDKLKCDTPGKGSSNQRFMKQMWIVDEKLERPIIYFEEVDSLYE